MDEKIVVVGGVKIKDQNSGGWMTKNGGIGAEPHTPAKRVFGTLINLI